MKFCVDCAAQQNQATTETDDYYQEDWIYSYRSSYYRSGYRPFMYSNQDYRSFDSYESDTEDFDDDANAAGGDFSDS